MTNTPAALVDTLDAAHGAAATAWYAADEAWSAELKRTYSDPGDARYDAARNAATPALVRLNNMRLAAREAFEITRAARQQGARRQRAAELRDAGR